ncbi:MAG: phosphoglycerate kinase, partial [Comamonadaceae bacterium]
AASPLQRCRGLAAALIERRPDLGPCSFDASIAEMDFGSWEGQAWSAIPRTEFDAWAADFGDAAAGGSGESTGLFMRRVAVAYDAWISEGRDALWVTHAGVIRAVWLLHAGTRRVASAGQWPGTAIEPGECVSIEAPPRR